MTTQYQASSRPRISASGAILAAICLIASGTGCVDQDATTTTNAIDACTLLTAADVDAVLGIAMGDPREERAGRGDFWVSSCHYDADTANGIRSAGLLFKPHHGAAGPQEAYTDYEAALIAEIGDGVSLTPIDGIGERAGWLDFDGSMGQLTIFQGPYMLILSTDPGGDADQLTGAKALAEKVLQRLPAQ